MSMISILTVDLSLWKSSVMTGSIFLSNTKALILTAQSQTRPYFRRVSAFIPAATLLQIDNKCFLDPFRISGLEYVLKADNRFAKRASIVNLSLVGKQDSKILRLVMTLVWYTLPMAKLTEVLLYRSQMLASLLWCVLYKSPFWLSFLITPSLVFLGCLRKWEQRGCGLRSVQCR